MTLHAWVLLPYKFTLLSNTEHPWLAPNVVLLPYKFTLLSNNNVMVNSGTVVLLPYKFTLLSNTIYPDIRS